MKKHLVVILVAAIALSCTKQASNAPTDKAPQEKHLFMDVHNLEPGKVTFEAVAQAHQKDLATQAKYGVSFIKYWVDEKQGKVYCLAESPDSASVYSTHKEAHGLVPDLISQVSDGMAAAIDDKSALYFDVHHLGAGKVTAKDVAGAHQKDLAVQGKFDVKFIDYWVDEKSGTVVCLSEAKDPSDITKTHKEAHGLIPDEIHKVQQGE